MIQQQFAVGLFLFLAACAPPAQTQTNTLPPPTHTMVQSTPVPDRTIDDSMLTPLPPVTPTPVALMDTIGQPIEGGTIAFTVNDINATMGAGRGDAPRGGHFYLVVNVTIQNISPSDSTPYDAAHLSILSADGTTYYPMTVDVEPLLESGTLNVGDSVTANAVFEIPDATSEAVLRYLYNVNDPPIQLNLGLLPAPIPVME